jgi:hypothetical protein
MPTSFQYEYPCPFCGWIGFHFIYDSYGPAFCLECDACGEDFSMTLDEIEPLAVA